MPQHRLSTEEEHLSRLSQAVDSLNHLPHNLSPNPRSTEHSLHLPLLNLSPPSLEDSLLLLRPLEEVSYLSPWEEEVPSPFLHLSQCNQ